MKLVSHRDVLIKDTHGNAINFKKDKPVNVPRRFVETCLAKGCLPAEGEELVVEEAKDETQPAPVGLDRTSALFDAFTLMVKKNNSSDFTAANTPKIAPVRELVKFDVDTRELKEAWQKYDAAMKAGEIPGDISVSVE